MLHWIQALRGIAALMVMFFHMHAHWDSVPVLSITSVVTRWGFSGVDIFFAISGFVVYRSAQYTIPVNGIRPFLKKRLLRIYLGYWPVLILVAISNIIAHHTPLPSLKIIIFSALLLYPEMQDNWLATAWSLTMEIYFYLWIILIALIPQKHQIKTIIGVMLLLAAWGIGWLFIDPNNVYKGQQPLRHFLSGFGLEFLGGVLLAYFYDRKAQLFYRSTITIPACTILIAAGLNIGMISPYFDRIEIMRAMSFGIMGLAALTLALALEQTPFAPPRWLVKIGDASYSLYLLHTLLLVTSDKVRILLNITSTEGLLFFLLLLPFAIVAISLLWYRWIERPIITAAGNST